MSNGTHSRQTGGASDHLRLVGGQARDPAPGDHSLIAAMFARLPREVPHTGDVTRLLGYEATAADGGRLRFFGIAVERIDAIPDGLAAWELGPERWRVLEPAPDGSVWHCAPEDRGAPSRTRRPLERPRPRGHGMSAGTSGGGNVCTWGTPLRWLWRGAPAVADSAGPIGEFTAPMPGGGTGACEFRLFASVPYDRRLPGFRDEVELVHYDRTWPAQAAEFAAWLRGELGPDVARRIEHYGSTAIPGMPAKPVLDFLVEVPSFELARERVLPRLNGDCWEYWWYAEHMVFFRRNGIMGERTAHVHLAPAGHPVWRGRAFRDHLRSHPAAAARYAALKRRLATEYRTDREAYTQGKAAFVQETLSQGACQ